MTEKPIELALPLIKRFEGFQATPYICPAGKRTVGYGHVIEPGDALTYPMTENAAETLLRADIQRFADDLYDLLPDASLTFPMRAALISLMFNIGTGAFAKSTLRTLIKGHLYEAAANEFMRWDKATVNGKKVVLPGLTTRRAAERALYLQDGMPK